MSTTRNSAYIISAQFSLLFSGALVNFGLGRLLGPSVYGQFGVVFAVATILNVLLTPGLMQAVSKFTASAKKDASEIAGSALKQQFVIGVALSVVYFFLAAPIALLLSDPGLADALKLLTPLALVYGLSAVYGGYLTGVGRFGAQASHLITFSVSRLVFTFVLAYLFALSGAIAALPLAAFAALLYFVFASRLKFSGRSAGSIYRFAFPTTAFVVLVTLFMSIDLFLVKVLLQDDALTGFYTAAGTVARIPYFVLTALGMILLPVVAGKLTERKDTVKFVQDAFRYVVMFLFPAAAVIAATGKPLVMLLYRSEYAAAGLPLSILAVGMAALTLSYLFAIVLNASGKPFLSAATAFGMLAVTASLNVSLIPKFQLVGAALATAATAVVSLAIFLLLVYSRVGRPFHYGSLLKVTAASVLLFAIALQIDLGNKFVLPAAYVFLAAVYIAALFVLREIKKEDVERLRGLLPEKLHSIIP